MNPLNLTPTAAVSQRPSLRPRSNLFRVGLNRLSRRVVLPVLATAIGLLGLSQPLRAQVFVPHTTEIDPDQLEYIGLELLQDADRWARFQQFAEAIPRAELASQLLPENAQVWAILGSLYVQTDRFDDGLAALLKARDIEPGNAAIRFALGSAYFQGGNYAGTISELHAGLGLMPNTPGALFDLGNAYFVTNQFERAIANYEDAFAQNAEFWPALNNIGLVRYEQGQVNRAIAQWETSTTIAPQEAEPLLARATALYARGDQEVGLALAEEAMRLDVRYADLDFLKENLWGEQLLKDVEELLATPRLQALIAQTSPREPMFIRP
jgi:tetratricopeptide (TPR) repeat protein